jgi:DNA-binding response OmpR family regulator
VTALASADAMREAVETTSFNLAILDIAMPGEDGLSLGRWLRSKIPVGIIYATAAGTPIDRIVGLELGADDYMVKPYELREMLARVRSVLRRIPPPEEAHSLKSTSDEPARRAVSFGDFNADLDSRVLTGPNGGVIEMAKSEFDVLEVFLTRPNRLLSRSALTEAIGLTEEPETSRAVDIRVMRLRKKIEADPSNPRFLRTVRGEGYIFALPDEMH